MSGALTLHGCEIPEEMFTILFECLQVYQACLESLQDGEGYGLKLFWKTDSLIDDPINAHSKFDKFKKT